MEEEAPEESPLDLLAINGNTEVSQKVRDYLQCPVCLEIPLPPIYVCQHGHIACTPCQDRLKLCPLCRSEFSKTRNFVAEAIVDCLNLKCKYVYDGCTSVRLGSQMVNHVTKECEHRPIQCGLCINGGGLVEIPFGSYFNHLVYEHRINGFYGDVAGNVEYSIPVERFADIVNGRERFKPFYFDCFGDKFLLHLQENGRYICVWICLCGVKSACKNYEATIVYDSESKEFQSQWKGRVNHVRDDVKDVHLNGRCLMIPLETIRHDSTDTAGREITWSYNVSIRQTCKKPTKAPPPTLALATPTAATLKVEEWVTNHQFGANDEDSWQDVNSDSQSQLGDQFEQFDDALGRVGFDESNFGLNLLFGEEDEADEDEQDLLLEDGDNYNLFEDLSWEDLDLNDLEAISRAMTERQPDSLSWAAIAAL